MNQNILEQLDDYFRKLIREEFAAVLPKSDITNQKNKERPIDTKQLCEHLGVTEPTIRRWKKKGKIPFFTIGTAVRFDLEAVIKSLEKNSCFPR